MPRKQNKTKQEERSSQNLESREITRLPCLLLEIVQNKKPSHRITDAFIFVGGLFAPISQCRLKKSLSSLNRRVYRQCVATLPVLASCKFSLHF